MLAHDISLINVQAGVALHLLDEHPEQARPALATIKETSRDALQELRAALDVLRRGEGAEAPRAPAPTLADLDALVGAVRAAGLDVELERESLPAGLPAEVQLAAFRIVQESLTNVSRHARATQATVRLRDEQRCADRRGRRRRHRCRRERLGRCRHGHHRHAPAGGGPGRHAGGRTSRRWRVPGRRRPAPPQGRALVVISVVIADDQALVRAGFRALLDAQDDIVVVAEAADGDEAYRLALEHQPNVVLMDIRMPGADGLTATRHIVGDARLEAVRVVILTTFDLDEYVFEAIRSGANGFLVKDTEPAELLRAVRAVVAGDALLSPGITRRLIEEFAQRAKDPSGLPDLDRLTDREREVVGLVAEGLSNEEIAARLVMSAATAKTHVSRAMVKVGARDRAQLVVFAYETGLVRPGWQH